MCARTHQGHTRPRESTTHDARLVFSHFRCRTNSPSSLVASSLRGAASGTGEKTGATVAARGHGGRVAVQWRQERSDRRHARSKTTAVTTTTRQAGPFARGITWARARRRAKSRECTSAPWRLATHATTVATLTCGDSQTCAMTALDITPFASTGATPIQVTAGAASASCVSSAGRAETVGQL